jgi:hypothetical protein
MNLISSFKDEPGHLGVNLTGDWNLEDLKDFSKALHARAREKGYHKILIDALQTNTAPNTSSSFFYGEYVSTMFSGYKIALVIRKEFISGLFENVAVNRGVFLSVFTDRQSALQWLLSADSSGE